MPSLLALVLTSCSDGGTGAVVLEEQERTERKQAISFTKRTVEQVRGAFMMAADVPASNVDLRKERYRAAVRANAGAHLLVDRRIRAIEHGGECAPTTILSSGSATLSSDSRLITAWHVVGDEVPDEDSRVWIHATFGGAYDPDTHVGLGTFVSDFDPGTFPVEMEMTYDYRSDEQHENPLLANRLWQLGLESWASHDPIPGADQDRLQRPRDCLRNDWPIEYDDRDQQQFMVLNAQDEFEGYDVAVLRVKRERRSTILASALCSRTPLATLATCPLAGSRWIALPSSSTRSPSRRMTERCRSTTGARWMRRVSPKNRIYGMSG